MLSESVANKLDVINSAVEKMKSQPHLVQLQAYQDILNRMRNLSGAINKLFKKRVVYLEFIKAFTCNVLCINISAIVEQVGVATTASKTIEAKVIELTARMLSGSHPQLLQELGTLEESVDASGVADVAAVFKRWLNKQRSSFCKVIQRPSDNFLMVQSVERCSVSVANALRRLMREEEDYMANTDTRICCIGPLDEQVVNRTVFLQRCFKSLLPSVATSYDHLFVVFDFAGVNPAAFVDGLASLGSTVKLSLVCCPGRHGKLHPAFILCMSRII